MYKKIYTYLGIVTLLCAYSSCNIHAAANRPQQQGQNTYKALQDAIDPSHTKEMKNAVLVIGVPIVPLDRMSHRDNYKEKITITSKELPQLEELTKPSDKQWGIRREMETLFMQQTLCSNAYTQYYVKNSCYLPHIYCPNNKNSNEPIYIVVRSLNNLVDGVFSEVKGAFNPRRGRDEDKPRFTERLEESVRLFTQYMQEVYMLVNIKALVINHDCKGFNLFGSQREVHKLQNIDAVIRSFGNLLYLPDNTINSQVFWLSWYENGDITDTRDKQGQFYWTILMKWFDRYKADDDAIIMYRNASLLYPFVKAHMPKEMSTLNRKNQEELSEYLEAYQHMPTASLPERKRQMTLLNINDIIPSLEEKKGHKQKENEPKVFSTIKNALIDLVNNTETPIIASDRFRFGFGMRYYYVYLYVKTNRTKGAATLLRAELLCKQGDTPQVTDPTKIGLEGFATYHEQYSTDRSVSFNPSKQDKAHSLDKLKATELALLHSLNEEPEPRQNKQFKPLQQENTSILSKTIKHSVSYLRDNHHLLVVIIQATYKALQDAIDPLHTTQKKNAVMVIGPPTVYLDSMSRDDELKKEVYKLVNIKARVINYDCKGLNDRIFEGATPKLQNIDAVIRSFGNLLYLPDNTINSQVFWLSWYVNSDITAMSGKEVKNKEKEFYWNILTKWFNINQDCASITMYRDASLLYLFVEARMPTYMSTTLSNNDQAELNEYKVFSLIKTLIDLVNNTQTTTISSDRFRFGFGMRYYYVYLEVKNKENEFYWNILTKWFNRHQGFESITMYRDASLLYLFVEARMPTDMSTTLSNNDQAELNQYKVFSLIKTLIDLVNNTQTTTISSDRFRFGFGMAYYYFYLYAEATQVFGTAEQLKNLLSGQRDTLQVADPTKIGLQGFAKFANKYSTDRSVSFNSSSLDNHKKAEQALLSSRHKEFKVQPLQQENTSILDNSAKDSESYLRDNPNLLVGIIVIIVVGGYILYHLKVKDTSVDTNNTKKRATNNSSANDQQSSTKKLSTHEAVKEQDQQSSTKNPSTYEEVKEHEEQPTDDNSAVHKLFNAFGTFFFAVLLLMIISVLVGLLLSRKRKGK